MINYSELADEQHEQMEWYSTWGLNNGICFPIHEPGNDYAVLTMILDESKCLSTNDIEQIKIYIALIANFVHQKYKLSYGNPAQEQSYKLTPRESECLIWAAKGKTAWETGRILEISEFTVNEYLTNSMRKLNTTNKVAAVAKAILSNEFFYSDMIDA